MQTKEDVYIPSYLSHLSYDSWFSDTPHPYLGTCRQCKRTVRILVTRESKLEGRQWLPADKFYVATAITRQVCDTPQAQYTPGRPGYWTMPCPTEGCIHPKSRHQSMITFKRIDGNVNEAVACNAKCTGATGPSCECSCGGANHGAGHGP